MSLLSQCNVLESFDGKGYYGDEYLSVVKDEIVAVDVYSVDNQGWIAAATTPCFSEVPLFNRSRAFRQAKFEG